MKVESHGGMILTVKKEELGEKHVSVLYVHHKSIWTEP
jgi:hypothetical protein